MIPAKAAPSLQSIQSGAVPQQPDVYSATNGQFVNVNIAAQEQQYPVVQDERQVRLLRPQMTRTVGLNADQTYQIPSSYQPVPTSDAANTASTSGFAAGSEAIPNLVLELRPPLHSATSFDYSKNANPSSSDNSFVDFSSASSGSNLNQASGQNQNVAAYTGNSSPLHVNQYREAHSLIPNAYNVPVVSGSNSVSNTIPNAYSNVPSVSFSDSYRQPDPVSINNYFSSPGSGSVNSNIALKSIPNNVVSNNLYTESDQSLANSYSAPAPVSGGANMAANTFANNYYNNPSANVQSTTYQNSIPSAPFGSNSNPTSANSYSDSNAIQSASSPGSFSNSKQIPTNVYSDSNSISSNIKRESSNNVSQPAKQQLNYYPSAGDYNKKEQQA